MAGVGRYRAAVLLWAGATGISLSAGGAPELVVHLHDSVGVPAGDLAGAKREVDRVFRGAGVNVTWMDGGLPERTGDAPLAPAGIRRVAVMLVGDTGDTSPPAAGCVLGVAVAGVARAYVFHRRVVDVSRARPIDLPVVLGQVMAHEIGHLLLPEERHSSHGIMRAGLDLAYGNPGLFSNRQAGAIRLVLGGAGAP